MTTDCAPILEPTPSVSTLDRPAPKALEAALLDDPRVVDCVVLERPFSGGTRRFAYVVVNRPYDAEEALNGLRKMEPDRHGPFAGETRLPWLDGLVPVTGLPLRSDGTVDEEALAELPVPDEATALRAEAVLAQLPGVERAAVLIAPRRARPKRLHLDDILPPPPNWVAKTDEIQASAVVSDATPPDLTRSPAMAAGPALPGVPGAAVTLPAALEHAAQAMSHARILHVADDGAEYAQSFADLLTEARGIMAGLRHHGLAPGAFVVFQLKTSRDILGAFWACLLGGFIPVVAAVPPTYGAPTAERDKLGHLFRALAKPFIVTNAEQQDALLALGAALPIESGGVVALEELRTHAATEPRHDARPDDVAFFSLSSGSTGVPKCIALTHRNILARGRGTNLLAAHERSDVILNWLPFDHIGSISDWHLRCVDLGCDMVYCSKERVLGHPLEWLRLIERYRITHSWAPNFAFALINSALLGAGSERWDLSSMKSLLTAGEAVSSSTSIEFLNRLAPHGLRKTAVRPAFGMAELGSGITYFQPTDEEPIKVVTVDRASLTRQLVEVPAGHPRSISFTALGPVIAGMSMRIVDDERRVLPEATIGRLHVRGDAVSPGYYQNDEANRVFLDDGWFETGDQGFLAAGQLYLTGRSKDCIIVNGANYFPVEMERAVEEVPGVEVSFTAAYTVRPRDSRREALAIFFSPAPSHEANLAPLLRAIQERLSQKVGIKADYWVPLAKGDVPKTAIGKIQRKELASRFEAGDFQEIVRRVDLLLGSERTVPDWFAKIVWRPRARGAAPAREPAAATVVLVDRAGLGERLCAEAGEAGNVFAVEHGAALVQRDERRFRADTTRADQLAAVLVAVRGSFDEGRLDVIDVRGYGRPPADAWSSTDVESHTRQIFDEVRALVDAVTRSNPGDAPVSLTVVSSHGQAVVEGDRACPAQSVVPPLLQAAARGAAWLETKHVDFAPVTTDADRSEIARQLFAELDERPRDEEVAYRGGLRYVARLADAPFAERPAPSSLERGGLYLVTGGLGGIGVALSRHLLSTFGARLLFVGRTPLGQERHDAGGSDADNLRAARWRELASLGDVHYAAADVTDAAALEAAVSAAEARWRTELAGVFHLAGAVRESSVLDETWSSLRDVLAPKALGALAIDQMLATRPAAFVVHFSSLYSRYASSTMGAYAAANRMLDVISQRERSERGRRSYCLAWSAWEAIGMGSTPSLDAVLRARGLWSLRADQAVSSLFAALAQPASHLLVGVERESPIMRCNWEEPPTAGVTLAGYFTARPDAPPLPPTLEIGDGAGAPVAVILERLANAPLTAGGAIDRAALRAELVTGTRAKVAPRTGRERDVAAAFKQVLAVEDVGVTESFFDLGGTSLQSLQLFAALEARLGKKLPASTLYEAPTVEKLALLFTEDHREPADCVVALTRATKGQPALFLVHDADGETVMYGTLAQLLETEMPVYAVRPEALPAVHTRIAEMAAHYVVRIRQRQEKGPYFLGGLCSGGVIAFEMACQLQAAGEEVGMVALLDSADAFATRRSETEERGKRFLSVMRGGDRALSEKVRDAIKKARSLAVYEMARRGRDSYERARFLLLRRCAERDWPLPSFLSDLSPRTIYRFARDDFAPGVFRGQLTLLRASSSAVRDVPGVDDTPAIEMHGDPLLGWGSRATRPPEVIDVRGGHSSMLQEPHVQAVAQILAERLRRYSPSPGRSIFR